MGGTFQRAAATAPPGRTPQVWPRLGGERCWDKGGAALGNAHGLPAQSREGAAGALLGDEGVKGWMLMLSHLSSLQTDATSKVSRGHL